MHVPLPPSPRKCACSPTHHYVWELCLGTHAMCEATRTCSTRCAHHLLHGGSTTSQGINSKFIDCEFHVKPGTTSMQLLEALKNNMFLRQTTPSEKSARQRDAPRRLTHQTLPPERWRVQDFWAGVVFDMPQEEGSCCTDAKVPVMKTAVSSLCT